MRPIDDRDLPSDADELRAIDKARRRICRHRSGDPDCECHDNQEAVHDGKEEE